jgi:hypothetical protein
VSAIRPIEFVIVDATPKMGIVSTTTTATAIAALKTMKKRRTTM